MEGRREGGREGRTEGRKGVLTEERRRIRVYIFAPRIYIGRSGKIEED